VASIFIDIASQFTGEKAFKKADKATDKLGKSVKNLAKGIGIAVSTTAILAFGKAAVKAAAEDEKAQKQLALALKNVGLGRDVAASEAYIQKLQSEFGIVDDLLRPAYQSLAIATQSTAKSQELMNIALDIAAANSLDVGQVTAALSKAYLGNNTALGKLGVGISKADLKAGNFDDIVNKLAKTFDGAASASADTFAGKLARLGVSFENAKEIIGKGLIDSFMILTDSSNLEDLQVKIEAFATSASENFKKLAGFIKENETLLKSIAAILLATFVGSRIIAGIAALVTAIGTINKAYKALRATAIGAAIAQAFVLNPFGAVAMAAGMLALIASTIKGVDALTDAYNRANDAKDAALNPKKYDNPATAFEKGFGAIDKYTKKVTIITKQTKEQLAAAKLKLAIDKANLALGKGGDVFDMEKIQLAAAEKNQAEQLGKVTSQAQLLQITNDLARLEVKQSILALEEAIASKDVAAITAATNKLNADLKIIGALSGQEVKLKDIKSILDAILPKDLINLANLNEAIRLLGLIGAGTGNTMATHAAPILGDPNKSPVGIPATSPVMVPSIYSFGQRPNQGGGFDFFDPEKVGMFSAGSTPTTTKVEITVVAPAFTDPNAVAEAINQYLTDATDRGTLRVAV
jgi:hypothetical protein